MNLSSTKKTLLTGSALFAFTPFTFNTHFDSPFLSRYNQPEDENQVRTYERNDSTTTVRDNQEVNLDLGSNGGDQGNVDFSLDTGSGFQDQEPIKVDVSTGDNHDDVNFGLNIDRSFYERTRSNDRGENTTTSSSTDVSADLDDLEDGSIHLETNLEDDNQDTHSNPYNIFGFRFPRFSSFF